MTPTGSVLRVTGAKRSCGWSACWAGGVCAEATGTVAAIARAERAKRRIWPPGAAPVLPGVVVEARGTAFRSATFRTGSQDIGGLPGYPALPPLPQEAEHRVVERLRLLLAHEMPGAGDGRALRPADVALHRVEHPRQGRRAALAADQERRRPDRLHVRAGEGRAALVDLAEQRAGVVEVHPPQGLRHGRPGAGAVDGIDERGDAALHIAPADALGALGARLGDRHPSRGGGGVRGL